jgi:hypothetical protein
MPLGVILTVNAGVPRDQEICTVTGVTVLFYSINSGHILYFLDKIKWPPFFSRFIVIFEVYHNSASQELL